MTKYFSCLLVCIMWKLRDFTAMPRFCRKNSVKLIILPYFTKEFYSKVIWRKNCMAVNLFLLPQYIVMCKLRKISVKLAYLELSHTVNYFHGIFLIKVKFHDFQSLQHTTHTAVLCDVWKSKQLTVKQISFFVKSIESKRL